MHNYVVPASVKTRGVNRMGKPLANDIIEAGRTALLVVDMQNLLRTRFSTRGADAARDCAQHQRYGQKPYGKRAEW